MTKVAIFGNAGGGKSTLCEALSRSKNLPAYQLKLSANMVGLAWEIPKNEAGVSHSID